MRKISIFEVIKNGPWGVFRKKNSLLVLFRLCPIEWVVNIWGVALQEPKRDTSSARVKSGHRVRNPNSIKVIVLEFLRLKMMTIDIKISKFCNRGTKIDILNIC